ncbi:cornifelin [Clonorchis sinensis]|uniref:Cornifelin n=1 Tax=Clonorchis sinensis TaxID=79923 RepID=G7YSZ5_CLOSI|nr:cornifelin [Clonorchis sinensis]
MFTDDRGNVILEQPRASGTPYRAWNDGLWDCGNNHSNCFLTAFCYTCMTCYLYEKYGEGCLTPCIIPMSAMVLTVQHRNRNGIRGSILEDCLTHAFCSPCAICRLYRDMKFVEEIRGTLN